MLNWLYKTFTPTRTSAARVAKPLPAASAPKPPPRPQVDWPGQLRAALGDDAALLNVALSADELAIKIEAVQALGSEEALKQAERQFRSHDRKVHRLCKQRLAAAVAQREARATAQGLLARTHSLMAETVVPGNHLVALDREWGALPQALLEPPQRAEFAALRDRLDTQVRERSEAQRQQQRQWQQWTTEAQQQLQACTPDLMAAAEHGCANDLAPRQADLAALRATRPETAATAALDQALAQALHLAALVQARLAWLEAPRPVAHEMPEAEVSAPQAPAESEAACMPAPLPRWEALPALPGGALAQVLNQRYARWAHAQQPARATRVAPAPAPPKSAPASGTGPRDEAKLAQLDALAQQAEAALAEGHVNESQRHLQALERALAAEHETAWPESLRARRQALRAEQARLKGWQQWGGERARDDLLAQAEALATQALATEPEPGPEAEAPAAPRLNLKTHTEAMRQLRERWKALDRVGGPASAAQWQGFDAALQTAYQPVAAQQALIKAARQENLAAREALLAALETLPLPEPSAGAPTPGAWREPLRELDRFLQAWRQLGPVQHTVPADAREALQQRLRQAVDRIEQPLDEVRRVAAASREPLIAQAEALVAARGRPGAMPEALRSVRELQAAWQESARQVPLARTVETALWARFKAATDAVYAQREAAFAEREAEQAAHLVAREALVARLTGLADDALPAEVARTLAEVEAGWRQPMHVPRAAAEALDGRFAEARAQVQQRLAAASRQLRQSQCDSLRARLALCVAREDGKAEADAAERWAACGPLPVAWEQALNQRWAQPEAAGPMAPDDVDGLLLQLEAAWALPSAPEWQAARRQLKLHALKQALEGRGSALQDDSPDANPDRALAPLLRQGRLSTAQRERLQALIEVLPHVDATSTTRPTR